MFKSLKEKASQAIETGKSVAQNAAEQVTDVKSKAQEKVNKLSDQHIDSNLDQIESYCSWCFEKTSCTLEEKNSFSRNVYICDGCKNKVVKCRACDNKAKHAENADNPEGQEAAEKVGLWSGNFCAVHEGEIANFENLNVKLESILEYKKYLERSETNYKKIARTTAFTVGGAAVIAPLALAAAPAIGGAVGSMVLGYSGAAATSSGLAVLGGGAVAAGGAGMAGGVAVLTAAGAALGGRKGAVISNSYYGDIDGFEIVRIREGKEPAVICIDGFLTQEDEESPDIWLKALEETYPENEILHVKWEAKRLKDLALTSLSTGGKEAAKKGLFIASKSASKQAAKKVSPLGWALQALDMVDNPWSVASVKAYQTGALLADIIARTDRKYILVGHSLGARVIYACLSSLATKEEGPYISDAYLLGGAVNNTYVEGSNSEKVNWFELHKAVSGKIRNYYSSNDSVLKYLYQAGEGVKFEAGDPIGRNEILCSNIINIDVSDVVDGHTEYKGKLSSFLST